MKKIKKREQNVQELWGYFKRYNIYMIAMPKGEKKRIEQKYLM